MANLALSIDDDLLQRVREVAVREQKSVDAVVREFLIRYIGARLRHHQALHALDAVRERNASSSSGRWSGDPLRQRREGAERYDRESAETDGQLQFELVDTGVEALDVRSQGGPLVLHL